MNRYFRNYRLPALAGQAVQRLPLLDDVYRKVLAISIVKAIDSCPGNCGNEDKIEYLKNKFPNFELNELTNRLKEIQIIEDRLKNYNEKKS